MGVYIYIFLGKISGLQRKNPKRLLGKISHHPWLHTCEDQSKAISSITPCASPKAWGFGKNLAHCKIWTLKNKKLQKRHKFKDNAL